MRKHKDIAINTLNTAEKGEMQIDWTNVIQVFEDKVNSKSNQY